MIALFHMEMFYIDNCTSNCLAVYLSFVMLIFYIVRGSKYFILES